MRRSIAFTLLELLTVVAIILIISSIVLSVLARGKLQAKKASCISQLRSIGQAVELYSQDNHGELPKNIYVTYPEVTPYASAEVLLCPMDRPPYLNRSSPVTDVHPTSYFPIPTIADGFYDALRLADPNFVTFVCLLHGERRPIIHSPLADTSGVVLRLRRDASVTTKHVPPRCWVGSDGTYIGGRDWWHIFSDETPTAVILEEILGIKGAREVPCRH